MGLLSRVQGLKKRDMPREKVLCPELAEPGETDCFVFVRGMTANERDMYEARMAEPDKESVSDREARYKDYQARVACQCCVDDKGQRIFTPFDVDEFTLQPASVVTRIFRAVLRLSGMDRESREALEKNSGAGPDAGRLSGSQSNGAVHLTPLASELAPMT